MMQRLLLKWYQDNKKTIWLVVLIIILVIGTIKILNNFFKPSDTGKNTNSLKSEINNEISGKLDSTQSLISNESVSKDELKSDVNAIDEFLSNCINGKVEEAYNLLTDECKEVKYNSLEKFKTLYYNTSFDTPKSYSVQNWENRTYRVFIEEDALATGKISSSTANIQDYITVVEQNGVNKLNIGNYVGRRNYNKTKEYEGITVEVKYKDVYMDYEIYNVKVTNNNENTIIFDDEKKVDSIYIEDEKNVKENVLTGEVLYSDMKIESGHFKTYNFKFANAYTTSRKMSAIGFERVTIKNDGEEKIVKIVVNI